MRSSGPRLLVAFVLAGFVAALAISCSSTQGQQQVQSCKDSCNGCCEAADGGGETCVPFAQQEFSVCGRSGAACRACVPGQFCSSGQCLQGDGGIVETDSGTPDSGTPDSGSGVDSGTDAGTDSGTDAGVDPGCGRSGEPCCHGGACYLPLACDSTGTCVSGAVDAGSDAGTGGPQPVGAACTADAGCVTNDCAGGQFTGGYCTKTCATNKDCPSGSKCGYNQEGTSLVCLATCTGVGTQGSCRSGYVCDSASAQDGTPVCVPKCTSTSCASCSTAGFCCGGTNANTGRYEACCGSSCTGSGLACSPTTGYCTPSSGPQPVGSSCSADTGCAAADGGTGTCIPPASGSTCGYTSNDACWTGGYCTDTCQSDGSGCAAGSGCANFGNSQYYCLDDCKWDGGQGDCRSGYVCDRFVTIGPNSSTTASCVNRCGANSDCQAVDPNTTCSSGGFCCGAAFYRCCDGNTCGGGLTCQTSGPNAGYCQ